MSLLGSRKHTFLTDGGRELFDCAGQGRIDVFFLSGGEIDGEGNINLVSIGDSEKPTTRFPGSFGSSYLYFVVPKVILFRTEHSKRTLVPKVSYISAPGGSDDGVYRNGGPIALITNRCLFSFDQERRRFRLESVHPGHTLAEVIVNTGFEFDRPPEVPVTPVPSRGNAAADAAGGRAGTGRGLSAVRGPRCSASLACRHGRHSPWMMMQPIKTPMGISQETRWKLAVIGIGWVRRDRSRPWRARRWWTSCTSATSGRTGWRS